MYSRLTLTKRLKSVGWHWLLSQLRLSGFLLLEGGLEGAGFQVAVVVGDGHAEGAGYFFRSLKNSLVVSPAWRMIPRTTGFGKSKRWW